MEKIQRERVLGERIHEEGEQKEELEKNKVREEGLQVERVREKKLEEKETEEELMERLDKAYSEPGPSQSGENEDLEDIGKKRRRSVRIIESSVAVKKKI